MTKPVWIRQAALRKLVSETAEQVYGPHWTLPTALAMGIGKRHLQFCMAGSRYFLRSHVEALLAAAEAKRSEVDDAIATLKGMLVI